MDRLHQFLDAVKNKGVAVGHFRGLLHLLIGAPIRLADGTPISSGMSWRAVAALLKKYRWDREAVHELGLEPADLPPRDREKFWYTAISRAEVGAPEAVASAQVLAAKLRPMGYDVGPEIIPAKGEQPET